MKTPVVAHRTVFITGGSAGVGRAVAHAYAAIGARVGLIARGEAGLRAAQQQCQELGAAAVAWAQADVSDADALLSAVSKLCNQIGQPDIWVNSAMVTVLAPSWQITSAEFSRVTAVNYLGTVHGTLAALAMMRERRRGVIVQVSSALGYQGIPLQSAYCATKYAVRGFTDSLRVELAQHYPGISVTMVNLPGMNTPLYTWMRSKMPRLPKPAGPVFDPDTAAQAVLWAAEHTPRNHNLGVALPIRMAHVLVPGIAEKFLTAQASAQQQTELADPGGRPDNLDAPLDSETDFGPSGSFTPAPLTGLTGKWRAALGQWWIGRASQ